MHGKHFWHTEKIFFFSVGYAIPTDNETPPKVETFIYCFKFIQGMVKLNFSLKFWMGVLLIVLSTIMGRVGQFMFLYYFDDSFIRWLSVAIYVLSWPPLFLGIWWVGKEYADTIRKYFSYKFYHQSMMKGTKKVFYGAKDGARILTEKAKKLKIKKKGKK